MNKHEAVWEWLRGCPYIQDMFFNTGLIESGATQLVPSESEMSVYIDGSKRMRYDATLIRYVPVSIDPNDTTNISEMVDFEKVGDWVENCSFAEEFPEFPDGCIVEDVRVLPNKGGFAVDQKMHLGKLMIQFQIDYLWNRKE